MQGHLPLGLADDLSLTENQTRWSDRGLASLRILFPPIGSS